MIARYRPTSLRRALAGAVLFAALAAVTLTDAPATAGPQAEAAAAPAGGSAYPSADADLARESLDRMREVGTAMYSWLTDAAADRGRAEPESGAAEDSKRIDWRRCPAIGHGELAELLVPAYIAELPATDAWGHPLEFCLERNPTPPAERLTYQAGIRSPGRNGSFEGLSYAVGPFPVRDFDRDPVWMDGYFLTWPSAKAE